MAIPDCSDVTESKSAPHYSSAQQNVEKNNDPALNTANEHTHTHLHHTALAEQGRDEAEYSKGTTYEDSNIPSQDPHDQTLHRRHLPDASGPKLAPAVADTEKGNFSPDDRSNEDPRTHTFSTFYLKYRIYFHLFVWLFFTRSVHYSIICLVELEGCSKTAMCHSVLDHYQEQFD